MEDFYFDPGIETKNEIPAQRDVLVDFPDGRLEEERVTVTDDEEESDLDQAEVTVTGAEEEIDLDIAEVSEDEEDSDAD